MYNRRRTFVNGVTICGKEMHYGTEDVYVSVLEHVQYLESSSLIIYFL